MALPTEEQMAPVPPGPFFMADEEKDLGEYHDYLRTLTPEALWDIHVHLDAEHYPRRSEAVRREMNRRRLFYISPYTPTEAKMRILFGVMLLFATLAALVHHVPVLAAGVNRFSNDLKGAEGAGIAYAAGQPIALVSGLTRGETAVLTTVADVFLGSGIIAMLLTVPVLVIAAMRLVHHRLRPDVFFTGLVALILTLVFLWLSL